MRGNFVKFFVVLALWAPGYTQVRIKMGTMAPQGYSWHLLLQEMGQEWQKATGGGVTLTIFAGGTVGDEAEMIRKMRFGQLQCAAVSAAGLADIDRMAYALMVPMMFRDYAEWDYVRERVNPELEKLLKERGFIVLAWSDVGWVHFFSKEPLVRPDQLKKMKLAASATEAISVNIMKWAGFNPVPIETVDSVMGLQTGMIDALYLPIIFAEGTNVFREAKNMNSVPWAPLQGALLMHEKGWKMLSADQQRIILDIAKKYGARLREDTRKREQESLQAMTSRGLRVWEVTGPDLAEWQETSERVYPRFRGELVPAELFDRVRQLRDEYRSAHSGSPLEAQQQVDAPQ